MRSVSQKNKSLVMCLAVCCFALAWLIACTTSWEPRRLVVRLQASAPTIAQLFYSTGAGFNEEQSQRLPVNMGLNELEFDVPLSRINALRFDPENNGSIVSILEIRAVDIAGHTEEISLDSIVPLHGVHLQHSGDALRSLPDSANSDPQTALPVPKTFLHKNKSKLVRRGCIVVLTAIGALLCFWIVALRASPRVLVPTCMALGLGLILTMASGSPTNHSVHPDEYSHITSYRYYLSHLYPPAIGDPAVLPSLSKYGSSYLFEWDVVYAITARIAGPFARFFSDDAMAARAFNVCLWVALLFMALAGSGTRQRILAFTLISPQIWYVYSYFNGDALPLTLTFLCATLVATRKSSVGRFIRRGGCISVAVPTLMIALGLLIVSKRNFIPIIPAILMWLMVLHLRPRAWIPLSLISGLALLGCAVQLQGAYGGAPKIAPLLAIGFAIVLIALAAAGLLRLVRRHPERRPPFFRLILIFVGALIVASPRIAWDYSINGGPVAKSHRITAFESTHATAGFQPSNRSLARRGVGLVGVMFDRQWLQKSIMSAYGVYGYMSIWTPLWTYIILGSVTAILILLGVVSTMRTYPQTGPALCVVVLGTLFLVTLSSLMHSWVGDFQAQGRYLLPAFPMLALLLARVNRGWQHHLYQWLTPVVMIVGVYSYAFYALPALAYTH